MDSTAYDTLGNKALVERFTCELDIYILVPTLGVQYAPLSRRSRKASTLWVQAVPLPESQPDKAARGVVLRTDAPSSPDDSDEAVTEPEDQPEEAATITRTRKTRNWSKLFLFQKPQTGSDTSPSPDDLHAG